MYSVLFIIGSFFLLNFWLGVPFQFTDKKKQMVNIPQSYTPNTFLFQMNTNYTIPEKSVNTKVLVYSGTALLSPTDITTSTNEAHIFGIFLLWILGLLGIRDSYFIHLTWTKHLLKWPYRSLGSIKWPILNYYVTGVS